MRWVGGRLLLNVIALLVVVTALAIATR